MEYAIIFWSSSEFGSRSRNFMKEFFHCNIGAFCGISCLGGNLRSPSARYHLSSSSSSSSSLLRHAQVVAIFYFREGVCVCVCVCFTGVRPFVCLFLNRLTQNVFDEYLWAFWRGEACDLAHIMLGLYSSCIGGCLRSLSAVCSVCARACRLKCIFN